MDLSFERKFQMAIMRADFAIESILQAMRVIIPVAILAVIVVLLLMWLRAHHPITK